MLGLCQKAGLRSDCSGPKGFCEAVGRGTAAGRAGRAAVQGQSEGSRPRHWKPALEASADPPVMLSRTLPTDPACQPRGNGPDSPILRGGDGSILQASEAPHLLSMVERIVANTGQLPAMLIAGAGHRMDRKIRAKARQAIYALRKTIVEPVLGQIKAARGLDRFRLRGLDKVNGE